MTVAATPASITPGDRVDPKPPSRHGQILRWSSYAACAWSLLYMLPHLYWALGGDAMLSVVKPSATEQPEWRLINAVASAMLTGAGLLALAVPRLPQRWLLRLPVLGIVWAGAVLSVAHALYGITDRVLIVTGATQVESRAFVIDAHAWVLWDLFVFEPWFLIEGIVLGLLGWAAFDRPRDRRRWLWISAVGMLAALIAAVLQVRVG